ncbi:MAG: flagellar M-ring protein FliF [Fibrobacterota bacterium]|nr:flagellar M-ring protein FliF [Fibrobacterota bacterium]
MSEYLKQLIIQLRAIWDKLNGTQKAIMIATSAVVMAGMITVIAWSATGGGSGGGGSDSGYSTLFVNLEPVDAAKVTDALKEMKVDYKLENSGRQVTVPKEQLYEARMQMARLGLPQTGGQGYEIFDKLHLGMTDFVQNLNYRRALEGELSRTIESLHEVDKARVHVTIPKPSLFTEKKEEATASVILKMRPGEEINERQVKGITHLVASSVEGLRARQVSVLDIHGNMLTKGFADNSLAEQTDHNMSLQSSVERDLERKVEDIFQGLLGPNKTRVKISAELDFDQVQKTVESYDPNTKVIRSQQRDENSLKGIPQAGSTEQKEGSITNYEFDKTMANIISTPGTRKRITVSVAVDGTYKSGGKEGVREYVPRAQEDLDKFTALVKNAVGFKPGSKDEVFVTNVQFDNQFLLEEQEAMKNLEKKEWMEIVKKYGFLVLILLFGIWFFRGLVKNLASAMNPPIPKYAGLNLELEDDKVPQKVQKQRDILERVAFMSQTEPLNIANLIKTWLHEEKIRDNEKGGGKKKQTADKD